jgi:hypothetical protein
MMTDAEATEALSILNAIGSGDPAVLVGEGWRDTFAGNVTWTFRGWTITVFNDCNSWDYIDHVIAPDGRRWNYDDMAELVRFWNPSSEAGWPSLVLAPSEISCRRDSEARVFEEVAARHDELRLEVASAVLSAEPEVYAWRDRIRRLLEATPTTFVKATPEQMEAHGRILEQYPDGVIPLRGKPPGRA